MTNHAVELNPRYERWRRLSFGVTWIIYASFYLTRQSFSVAKDALEHAIGLTRQQLGSVDAAYLTTYSLGQFFFGPLVDRFGPRRILVGGLTLSALAAVGSGCSTAFAGFVAFAIMQGVAQATGWSATSKVMSSWFSLEERGRVLGWWCTHYTAGAAVASPFAGLLMDHFGKLTSGAGGVPQLVPFWPAAFWGPAAVLAIVAVFCGLMLKNRPEELGLPPIEEYHGEVAPPAAGEARAPETPHRSWQAIGEVLSSPSVWMLAVAYFPIKLARYSFYFWGPKFVAESLGTEAFSSAMTAAWMPIGGIVGVIASGYVSDKLFQARRAPVIVLSLLATAAIMLVGLSRIESVWVMSGFFFAVGVFLYGPDSMVSSTAAIDFGRKRGAGAATGFVNGVGSFGAILGGYLPGVMTDKDNWTLFFQISLVGLVLSAIILAPLWRTKPPAS